MARSRILAATLFVCSAVLLAGCSSGPKRYKVTGTVKYKGVPLSNGSITFTPEDASGVIGGAAIKDGVFEIPQTNGLAAGKYKVSISAPDPKGPPPPKEGEPPAESRDAKELIPEKYNAQTELKAEVKAEGPNEFTFDLK